MTDQRSQATAAIRLKQVHERIEQWRSSRTTRSRIPQDIWADATILGEKLGVYPVARALRLDDQVLRQRVDRHESGIGKDLACLKGWTEQTKVRGIADGARHIRPRMEEAFHACDFVFILDPKNTWLRPAKRWRNLEVFARAVGLRRPWTSWRRAQRCRWWAICVVRPSIWEMTSCGWRLNTLNAIEMRLSTARTGSADGVPPVAR
jgi:hypothetical protein